MADLNVKDKIAEDSGFRRARREQEFIVRDFVTALALCHNVTPTFPNDQDRSVVEY